MREEKRVCDCWLNVGECYCGVEDKEEPAYMDRGHWVRKEILDKKVMMSYSVKRGVVLEFENVCDMLGLSNRSLVVEGLLEDFIERVRGVGREIDV